MEPRDEHAAATPLAHAGSASTGPLVPSGVVPGPPRPGPSSVSVTEALQELDAVSGRPLSEHPDGFARVHAGLQRALADIDDA